MTSTKDLVEISGDLDAINEHPWTLDELWRVPDSPGRFEGEPILTRILYEFMINGLEDDLVGFGDGEAYSLFSEYQIGGKGPLINAILTSDSQGFISLESYDSNRELIAAWKELQKAAEKVSYD